VRTAASHPDWLVVGIDANAAGLHDGLRRAQRAKVPNALFVVASADALPDELAGWADEVRIQFPWGSLLTAVLRAQPQVLGGVARLLRPGGELTVLVSVAARDGIDGFEIVDAGSAAGIGRRIVETCHDLVLRECRTVTPQDVAASHSTWAKRLGVARSRTAWLLRFRRRADGEGRRTADPRRSD
jgi:16S rRNA (adenine(1408)-N(1))-methyltransferase